MTTNIRERGRATLNELPESQLPVVVRWLELLADVKNHPDTDPEELWLLATCELEKMDSEIKNAEPIDDWSLTSEQMLFLMQHHNALEAAYAQDDLEFLRAFAASDEYLILFGDMGFDEAYDRYETMIESDDGS